MDDDPLQGYLALLQGTATVDRPSFMAGRAAHLAGAAFHDGPEEWHTAHALSWRMGWKQVAQDKLLAPLGMREVEP